MSLNPQTLQCALRLLQLHNPLNALLDKATHHHHKCASGTCGHVWSHSQSDMQTSAAWEAGRSCPQCGTQQTEKCEADGSPYRVAFKLSEREVATVLAALRQRQASLDDNAEDPEYAELATSSDRLQALSSNDIDHLAERLNR